MFYQVESRSWTHPPFQRLHSFWSAPRKGESRLFGKEMTGIFFFKKGINSILRQMPSAANQSDFLKRRVRSFGTTPEQEYPDNKQSCSFETHSVFGMKAVVVHSFCSDSTIKGISVCSEQAELCCFGKDFTRIRQNCVHFFWEMIFFFVLFLKWCRNSQHSANRMQTEHSTLSIEKTALR